MNKPHSGLLALTIIILSMLPAHSAFSQDAGPFNLFFNFAGSYQFSNGDENGVTPPSGAFRARDLRVEMKGVLTESIYYRFRQNLRKNLITGSLDGFANGTDMMFVGYKWNDKYAVEAGKICQHWGGFDYDENPLYIYQYSDYIDHMEIFFAGADFIWRPVEGQEFVFELSNPSNSVMPIKYPVNALVNWNGSFRNGSILTRCAVGGFTQDEGVFAKLVNGGVKFNYPSLQWYVDYMLEKEGIDRLGIASADLGAALAGKGEVLYQSRIAKVFWQFAQGWNLVLKGSWDSVGTDADGKYRDGLMALCCLEYYPAASQDLRFFIAGTGHRVIFRGSGLPDPFTTGRAEIGLIYRIKAY